MDEVAWDEQSNMPPPIQLSLFLFFSALPNELKEEIKKELTGTAAPSGVWNWRMKFQQSAGASAIDECWFWFVFDWWVMGASSANGSAKRREPNQKPTMKSMKEEGNPQWMKWNEDSNKPINKWNQLVWWNVWWRCLLLAEWTEWRGPAPKRKRNERENWKFLIEWSCLLFSFLLFSFISSFSLSSTAQDWPLLIEEMKR